MSAYPRLIAHRCGGALAPENTLAGLEAAARLGCRGVEFDVMLTADGVPILMHDDTLDRTTCLKGRVDAIPFARLRAGDPSVPTLAEALETCRRHGFWTNIELKPATGHDAETGEIVGRWLAAHWNGIGVVSSFSTKSASVARRLLPEAGFAMLFEALPDDWAATCAALRARAVHLDAARVDAGVAETLRAAGMPWAAYTVNDRDEAERLFGLGAASVFTDRPDLLAGPFA